MKRGSKRDKVSWPKLLCSAWFFTVIFALLSRSTKHSNYEVRGDFRTPRQIGSSLAGSGQVPRPMASQTEMGELSPPSAAEIVAYKLAQFGQSRREIVHAIGRKSNKAVPPEIEEFFDAVEAGQWDEIDQRFGAMARRSEQHAGFAPAPEMEEFWSAVFETHGTAEQVHLWPAQKLLDYGQEILGSLKPGMIYLGGTDAGRFIPALLNENSEAESHVILTQNAFADSSYREYVQFLYGDRLNMPDAGESDAAFQHYITDAQKRLEHDEKFPNEPRRIRADEQVAITDDKVQVSGRAGVMDVNERLFQMILQKNPGATFAVEESYPMHHTYAGATPLGPIMEIRAQDANAPIDDARVDQSLQYWRETRDQLLSDAGAQDSGDSTLLTYARLAAAQGNLLAYSNRAADAEQAYRLGIEIHSGSPEAVYGLANILSNSGRGEEAKQIIANAQQANPDFQKYADPSSSWMVTHSKR